ncbi:MAG: glycosyltransferase family 2 protein [Actinomycetota bacterium]
MAGTDETDKRDPLVSTVILAFNRKDSVRVVLDRLSVLPVDEVVVVDNGTDGTAQEVEHSHPHVRVLRSGENLGIAGRNKGAELCRGRYLLMLDDDSYPLPGALERMVATLEQDDRIGVVGGFVRDVDESGNVIRSTEPGTFDWFLRGDRTADASGVVPAFFFPEGASLFRREAFDQVGGFFEPYFATLSELDLATRLIADGWDVRYDPEAPFDHMKAAAGRDAGQTLRLRVRNQLWYFRLRFPTRAGAWRAIFYGVFDLIECTYRKSFRSWAGGIADAWRQRALIRGRRSPLPERLLPRVELDRHRLHVALLKAQLGKWVSPGARG